MPQVYNGGQSPLEYFAIHGHPDVPNSGRNALINTSFIGKEKYPYKGPYRNPEITGNANDSYKATHTNALADSTSPYNGKGTGDGLSQGVYQAIVNYNGGSIEDIKGVANENGSGRNPQIGLNVSTWGYGPSQLAGSGYKAPDMSGNKGQIII